MTPKRLQVGMKNRKKFTPILDSDHQMFMQQDGLDAYGIDNPCEWCDEAVYDHTPVRRYCYLQYLRRSE